MMKPIVPATVFLASLVLAACGGAPESGDTETLIRENMDRIEAIREGTIEPEPLARRVEKPRNEAWLDRKLTARYVYRRADDVFRLVAQGTPVMFDFDLYKGPGGNDAGVSPSVPKVLWSPRAVTIRQHLDSISTQADWSWTYAADRDVIIVRDIETNRFTLAAQPVSTLSRSSVRNLVSDGEGQNDNTGEVNLDPYREEVLQAVRGVLGLNEDSGVASGGSSADPRTRVTIMPSANLLSVTAKPNAMRQVEDLIGPPTELTYNESTAATVRIDLTIMEVELNDTRERDLLVQLIRNSSDLPLNVLLGGLTAGLPGYSAEDTDSGTNVAVLGPSESSGRYAGSGAVLQWLDQFGKASVQYSDTVEVQNNRVVTRDQTVSRQYVKSITVESLGEGSDVPTREIDIDELRTGIVFHMQPTVVDDEITVRISLSRAALVREEPYDYIGIQGTNFTTENFNRVISVSLEDGEPKLLSSFSEREVRETRRSRIPLFGSLGRGWSDRQRETLLLITATRVRGQGA